MPVDGRQDEHEGACRDDHEEQTARQTRHARRRVLWPGQRGEQPDGAVSIPRAHPARRYRAPGPRRPRCARRTRRRGSASGSDALAKDAAWTAASQRVESINSTRASRDLEARSARPASDDWQSRARCSMLRGGTQRSFATPIVTLRRPAAASRRAQSGLAIVCGDIRYRLRRFASDGRRHLRRTDAGQCDDGVLWDSRGLGEHGRPFKSAIDGCPHC